EWLISSSADESRSVQLQINPTAWRSAILLVGCLAAPVPRRASSVYSPCDVLLGPDHREGAECFLSFLLRKVLSWFSTGSSVGRRGPLPPIHPRIFPIPPIDFAMEPQILTLSHLLTREDIPRRERRLPRPLLPEQDQNDSAGTPAAQRPRQQPSAAATPHRYADRGVRRPGR